MRRTLISIGVIALVACNQSPDPDYAPEVQLPMYGAGSGPVLAVDTTHDNRHTLATGYEGFGKLTSADGYQVVSFDTPFDTAACAPPDDCAYDDALAEVDTLVIANAETAISEPEADRIEDWVRSGGSLLLIADHANYPAEIQALATRLGLNWLNLGVAPVGQDPTLGWTETSGLEPDHPVTRGRCLDENVPSVQTFGGSAFELEPGTFGVSVLSFPDGLELEGVPGNYSSAAALWVGQGRVFASAEAGMFTAQILTLVANISYDGESPVPEEILQQVCVAEELSESDCELLHILNIEGTVDRPFGMQTTPHNEQLLLNILHWLDKRVTYLGHHFWDVDHWCWF